MDTSVDKYWLTIRIAKCKGALKAHFVIRTALLVWIVTDETCFCVSSAETIRGQFVHCVHNLHLYLQLCYWLNLGWIYCRAPKINNSLCGCELMIVPPRQCTWGLCCAYVLTYRWYLLLNPHLLQILSGPRWKLASDTFPMGIVPKFLKSLQSHPRRRGRRHQTTQSNILKRRGRRLVGVVEIST